MTENKPTVAIIAGPNGAGKSTVSRIILEKTLHIAEYINADDIAKDIEEEYPTNTGIRAGRIMLTRCRKHAKIQDNFAFETTLSTRGFAPWLKMLKSKGYQVYLIYMWLQAPEISIARVEARVRLGGHDIEEYIIKRRYYRSLWNFFHLYQPLADTWSVYDNSDLGSPKKIANGTLDQKIEIVDEDIWLKILSSERRKIDRGY